MIREFLGRLVRHTTVLELLTIIIIIVVTVMCCGRPHTVQPRHVGVSEPIIARASATVTIEVHGCSPAVSTTGHLYGSGVIINEHHVLTAAHVVAQCTGPITITRADGAKYDASIEIVVLDGDLARIKTAASIASPGHAPIFGIGKRGQVVCFVAGSPVRRYSCGVVEHMSDGNGGIYHSATTIPGNSGSPIYDARGRLLGIVVTRHDGGGAATPIASRSWLVTAP